MVGKDPESPYVPSRTLKWLKVKHEPPRLSRRLHFLRGWGPWERRTGTHRKCGNARYGWSGSIKPSTRRSELERENRELKRANEILKLASAFFAKAELDRRAK